MSQDYHRACIVVRTLDGKPDAENAEALFDILKEDEKGERFELDKERALICDLIDGISDEDIKDGKAAYAPVVCGLGEGTFWRGTDYEKWLSDSIIEFCGEEPKCAAWATTCLDDLGRVLLARFGVDAKQKQTFDGEFKYSYWEYGSCYEMNNKIYDCPAPEYSSLSLIARLDDDGFVVSADEHQYAGYTDDDGNFIKISIDSDLPEGAVSLSDFSSDEIPFENTHWRTDDYGNCIDWPRDSFDHCVSTYPGMDFGIVSEQELIEMVTGEKSDDDGFGIHIHDSGDDGEDPEEDSFEEVLFFYGDDLGHGHLLDKSGSEITFLGDFDHGDTDDGKTVLFRVPHSDYENIKENRLTSEACAKWKKTLGL